VEYLTVAQAADVLGLSDRTVRNRIERGVMQAVRMNPRLLLIARSEVERWQGRGKMKPGPKPRQRTEVTKERSDTRTAESRKDQLG
jgi:excisionase family DNA binding protein